jgi:eukaryotic-like serine/threonine-protein kinase
VSVDRWLRVKEVFASALEAGDRGAYLTDACRDDPELRSEVESLLEAHEDSGDFIERPAAAIWNRRHPQVGLAVAWVRIAS